jgi:hypothetical protein
LPQHWQIGIIVRDINGEEFENYMTFAVYQFPRWSFALNSKHIDSQNSTNEASPPFTMGTLTITNGIDMPTGAGVPDTFASKGLVFGAGRKDNRKLQITATWGATGWREYLVQMPKRLLMCRGAYKLDFRYSLVDTQGESDVHTQRIDFLGPTDISLTYLKSLDVSS